MAGPSLGAAAEPARPLFPRALERNLEKYWEYWLLGAVVVLQLWISWHYARQSFYITDDLVIFQEAAGHGLSVGYLTTPAVGQLSIGGRLVAYLIQHNAPFNFGVGLGFLLALHSAAVVLLHRILRLIAGPAWWTFPVVFAYGISVIFLPSFEWFSSGLGRFWVEATTLAAIHAYLCWRATGKPAWLAWSVVAVAGGLLFSFQGLFAVAYLLMFRLLLLDDLRVRDFPRTIAREWRIWGLYVLPAAVFLLVALTRTGQQTFHTARFHDVIDFFRISWLDAFVPGIFGVNATPPSPVPPTPAVVVCQLILLAAVALSVSRRRSAWRAWAVLAIAFLANGVLVIPRVREVGPYIAEALRYYVDFLFLVPIVAVFAFAQPRLRARGSAAMPALPAANMLMTAGLALAVYMGLTLANDGTVTRGSDGKVSHAYFANLRADVAQLHRTGIRPVFLNGPIQPRVIPFWVKEGANQASATLPLFLSNVGFDEVSDETFSVKDDGHVQPLAFQPTLSGSAAQFAKKHAIVVTGAKGVTRGDSLCVSAASRPASVEFVAQPIPLRGHDWYLRTTYRTSRGGAMFMFVNRGVPYPATPDRILPSRPASATVLTHLDVLPPPAVPTFGRLRLDMPPGRWACFDRFVVGWYSPRPNPPGA